jgi:hypothetical protein
MTEIAFSRHPVDSDHHREVIARFLSEHPDLMPKTAMAYASWSDVPQMPLAASDTMIFVDGGILRNALDVGHASVVNDGGIISAPLRCGVLYRDGGLTDAVVEQRGKRFVERVT